MSDSTMNSGNFADFLTVDPNVMMQKSASSYQKIRQMQAEFQSIEETMGKTRNYWLGEAGDAHRSYYESKKPEIEEAFKRLLEQVQDLNKMASVYVTAEQQIHEIAEDLPSDVIV